MAPDPSHLSEIDHNSPLISETATEAGTTDCRRPRSFQVATNLFLSFKFAWQGVAYAFVTQRNFRIDVVVGAIVLGLSLYLQIPKAELAIVSLTIALVMVLELLNTALEAVVDLTVGREYHELAKIAKDCAAGAVLISAIAAVTVAGVLLLPRLLLLGG
jgi:diacylglycerol kinase (ATP)